MHAFKIGVGETFSPVMVWNGVSVIAMPTSRVFDVGGQDVSAICLTGSDTVCGNVHTGRQFLSNTKSDFLYIFRCWAGEPSHFERQIHLRVVDRRLDKEDGAYLPNDVFESVIPRPVGRSTDYSRDENCSSCGQLHPREKFYGGCPNCGAPHQSRGSWRRVEL